MAASLVLVRASPAPAQTRSVQGIPQNASDIDSVEGLFCISAGLATPGVADPICNTAQNATMNVPSLRNTDRIAIGYAGRVWGARYSDTSLSSGIILDVGGDDAVVVAGLPPLPSDDFVDSLVLVGGPQMWTLPNGTTLALRTPVVRSAQGRLFVYVWWTSSENYQVDGAGNLGFAGNVAISPGWYELTGIISTTSPNFAVGSPATSPSSNAALGSTFRTLSHSRLGGDVRVAALLYHEASMVVMAVHVKAAINGAPVFALFPFSSSELPDPLLAPSPDSRSFPIHTGGPGSVGGVEFGARWAWSPKHFVTNVSKGTNSPVLFSINPEEPFLGQLVSGPFIFERGRTPQVPGYDSRGEWTLIPGYRPEDYFAGISLNGSVHDVYAPFGLASDGISATDYLSSIYKVVSADDPFEIWQTGRAISLWVLTQSAHVWGVQVLPPTSMAAPQRIDPWPDMMLETSGYQAVQDPTRGTVYVKLASGFAELPSEPLRTLGLAMPRERLALDVFVPAAAQGWVGDVQMSFELVAAGIPEQYLGYASLNDLPKGSWSTVSFDFPATWQQALLGDFPGVRFRTFVNTSVPGVQVGELRFEGALSPGQRAPHQPRLDGVRTTPELDFETDPGWTGPKVEKAYLSSSGLSAARLTSSGWTELLSPPFSTSTLPALGSKLSIDVYVPSPSPESHWQGDLQAFLTCINTPIQNAWIDWSGLQNLFSNEYNTVSLDLPPDIQSALQVPGRTCQIRLTVNTAPTATNASFYVDRVGFRD